ncbi:hypothetical protein GCM10008927_16060 [Amylibacter ulvae]|uniref:Uncharacterized protein n=1 Tax=Paramylibacter ulvae TaxID=1651968 RepID=A0ABQ3D0F2_9RHOB|nr:hypothetical protein GCM10008927_16060 [Amylibacter ulvae]
MSIVKITNSQKPNARNISPITPDISAQNHGAARSSMVTVFDITASIRMSASKTLDFDWMVCRETKMFGQVRISAHHRAQTPVKRNCSEY